MTTPNHDPLGTTDTPFAQVGAPPVPELARAGGAGPAPGGAALRSTREYLGLPLRWLAAHLDVAERTLSRWEDDLAPIPAGVWREVRELDLETQETENALFDELDARPEPMMLETYRTDADLRAARPDWAWPASWHRAIVARLARSGLEVTVHYIEDQ